MSKLTGPPALKNSCITSPNLSLHDRDKMGTRKERSWSEVWYDFSQSTTLHGVSKIGERHQHLIRRLIWILIVLGGVGLFVFQLINSIIHYRSWPVTVNVKINYNKTLRFPAVTLCNQNDFRASAVAETGRYYLVRDFYSNLYSGGIDLRAHGAENLNLEEIYNSSAHSKDDMIVSCTWDESDCGIDDFETTVTDYGFCYTFNSGRNGRPIRQVSNTGADRGLRLRLNIEQYEYMRGPNPGAGIKILIHDADEIPLVRDLGQAIPPGSYAFVGIQILQVNNLPPPHGQCDDSKKLDFFEHYSISGCLVDCKETLAAKKCGCRDVYMPADKYGNPPVCTLEKYQSCYIPSMEEFTKQIHKCNCPIPCHRTMFDPTISYAITTNYETDSLLRSERVNVLRDRYIHARETIQRMEESHIADDTTMVNRLNLTVNRVSQMLQGIARVVHDIRQELREEMSAFSKRAWFHWRWGLEQLEYIGRHDFTRGWDVMVERSFSYLTTNYQEDVAYVKDAVRRITDPNSGLSLATREALVVDLKGKFFAKRVIGERSLANFTQVYHAFSTGEPLIEFRASPQRRYDLSWITLRIIRDDPKDYLTTYFNKLVLRTNEFLDAMNTMEAMLDEAMNNNSVDMDALDVVGDAFETAARSFNYYRFMFEERVAQGPIKITAEIKEDFTQLNDSLAARLDEVELFLEELIHSLTGADTSWQHILMLNQLATTYLVDNNFTKTNLATNFTSPLTETAIKDMKSFLSTIKSRSRDIESLLTRLERAYGLIWRNMLMEHALSPFYGKISQDVNVLLAQPVNNTERVNLVSIIAYMLGKTKSYVSENPKEAIYLTNADFISTSVDEKMIEIKNLFEDLEQITGIEAVMKDEDDFFDAFHYTQLEMETFLANNVIDENFFGKNFMQVDVFMKELSYEEIDQQVAYDMTSLWSDIGGSIGLFIGASVITVFEIFDVIIRNSWRFYCKCGQKSRGLKKREDNGYAEKPMML